MGLHGFVKGEMRKRGEGREGGVGERVWGRVLERMERDIGEGRDGKDWRIDIGGNWWVGRRGTDLVCRKEGEAEDEGEGKG
jgi:hypothetical protein